jgi:hypothetical protein
MGKQYTTDTLGLEGEETVNEKTGIVSRISYIATRKAKSEAFDNLPVTFAIAQNYFNTRDIEPINYNIISIGGGSDETSEIKPSNQNDANFIRFFTKTQSTSKESVGVERFTIKPTGILNMSFVPVFRSQEDAIKSGGLVNGDVYQDGEQNLKIVFLLEEGERARIE